RSLVVQKPAPLPAVGPCGVEAEERHTLSGLLEVHPVLEPAELQPQVPADDRLDPRPTPLAHATTLLGAASRALKYMRFAMNGWRSPSTRSCLRRISAKRSLAPGAGDGSQKRPHSSALARRAKL